MKKAFLMLLLLLDGITTICQTTATNAKLNFDFEISEQRLPKGWNNFGDPTYKLSLDSVNVKNGRYSAVIEFNGDQPGFKAWAFTLPANYDGKRITLTGFIKTENVTGGYAGLWLRLDPSIAFNNMSQNGVMGTTDWKKYEITLDMKPEKTKQIVVGGLLVGKGKMWLDNLEVTIDGQSIEGLTPFARTLLPAEKDKEFDNGSGIATIPVDKRQIENLRTLGLIWGFLKYYHPNIAKGDYNWDYELFRILPKVQASEDKKSRDELLVRWIDGFGKFEQGKGAVNGTSEIKLKPDLDWITTSNFSAELSASLLKVKNADRPKEHFYVGLQPFVGNADFKNESGYSSMKYPDAGFRLLALYRYWNIIQYYFPYKNLIEEDWKNVLPEFIPGVVEAKNETDYTLAVLELIGRVHDTHANIWGRNEPLKNYFGLRYAPVQLTFVEGKPAVTDFYVEKLGKETGLEIGDVLTSINGNAIDKIVKERLKYSPASNYPTQLRDIAPDLLRTNDSTIMVDVLKNNKKLSRKLKTFASETMVTSRFQKKDTCFKMVNDKIGYLYLGSIKSKYLPAIYEKVKETKGLIIDLRCYPSEFVVFSLGKYLMSDSTAFAKFSHGSVVEAGMFTIEHPVKVGGPNQDYYKGKVVILINEITQSQAEYTTMAFRASPTAIVLGSTTAGADGNISRFSLPGGINTVISGIGVYYPDGKETQRIGIVPNVEVKPTIKGIKSGKDELLIKAIEMIDNKQAIKTNR
jgi:C-terminal processing protease CtpA/Prc